MKISGIWALLFCCVASQTFACTDFRLVAQDHSVLITRSMEFTTDLKSNVRSSPRGRDFATLAPDGSPGLSWKAKYGYVFLDGLDVDASLDGMNEAGLSVEDLYLPRFAGYQAVPKGHNAQALPYLAFADWVLSNFSTVDEVKKALGSVYVFGMKVQGLGDTIFPLHFAIYDASGKGLVVEYVNGALNVYDNIGVLTNSPTYDWQTLNLINYLHLAPINPPAVIANGVTYASNGQGYGMIGLPGDASPPSRFVKIATLMRVALPAQTAADNLNLGEHIINNVDIMRGLTREAESGKYANETTQWVVFKDLTNKIFYYRTYSDLSLHAIYFKKLDFSEKAARLKMPINSPETIHDMTEIFIKAKVNQPA